MKSTLPSLRRSLQALGFLSLSLAGASTASANDEALLKLFSIMKAKGSISQAEYDELVAATQVPDSPKAATKPKRELVEIPQERAAKLEERLEVSEAQLAEMDRQLAQSRRALDALDKQAKSATASAPIKEEKKEWYDKLDIGGYTQMRFTSLLNNEDPELNVPADRSVSESESFFLRRARLKFSGDLSDHLYLYAQLDAVGGSGGNGDKTVALRDFYGDLALDSKKEHRFRLGQSKVPFGWVNMQSSQNRLAMERPDALNSAVEGERDLGVFYMWAPESKRKLLKKLVKDGLKGSGDYGVVSVGAYAGQGINRSDLNGDVHFVARTSVPFEFAGDQIAELGIAAYTGSFTPSTGSVANPFGPGNITPTLSEDSIADQRVGVTAILYPKPIGIEAEWTWGEGPELNNTFTEVSAQSLQGGYIQASYHFEDGTANWFPFLRYQYYDGGRKFARNAPSSSVSEIDLGIEWQPIPDLEIALMYTHTFERTNTSNAPYNETQDADRIGVQAQWNY